MPAPPGLSEPAYWGSWALTHWLLLAASGALCAAAGAYPFSNSSTLVMLGFFWLYGAALVSYSYAMSTLFSSSRVAGTASQLLYALSMLPGFLMPLVRVDMLVVYVLKMRVVELSCRTLYQPSGIGVPPVRPLRPWHIRKTNVEG